MKKIFGFIFLFITAIFITSCTHSTSNELFKVTATSDGLEFKINPKENHKNIIFYVIDTSNGKDNVRIIGNNQVKKYNYPFVQKDKTYQVYAIFYNEN